MKVFPILQKLLLCCLPLLLCFSLLFMVGQAPVTAATPTSPNQPVHDEQLQLVIKQHIQTVIQDKTFALWETATVKTYPLGPGTKSWLATLSHEDNEIGYMIIEATDNNVYQVVEYGIGKYDPAWTSHISLLNEQQFLQLQYIRPFLALQTLGKSKQLASFFTMEQLPISQKDWDIAVSNYTNMVHDQPLTGVTYKHEQSLLYYHQPIFDPYERLSWLTKPAVFDAKQWTIDSSSTIQKKLIHTIKANKQLRFVTTQYDEQILDAYAITGFHQFENTLFVALHQISDTLILERYIPLQELILFGHIYP